jgi:hypothetical protein
MLVKIETCYDGESRCTRGLDADIFTPDDTLDELHGNIKEAASVHCGDTVEPIAILTLSEVTVVDACAGAVILQAADG